MELVGDILSQIAPLSGKKITITSKFMRDAYFRKNGIWLYPLDFISNYVSTEEKIHFPDHFYKYKLNIDFANGFNYEGTMLDPYYSTFCEGCGGNKGISFLTEVKQAYIEILRNQLSRYIKYSEKLEKHVIQNTQHIEKAEINLLTIFNPKVIKTVRKIVCNTPSYLDMKDDAVCYYQPLNSVGLYSFDPDETNLILRFLYGTTTTRKSVVGEKIIPILGVSYSYTILPDKFYPKLTQLIFLDQYEDKDIVTNFNQTNFPRLSKIDICPDLFDWVVSCTEGIKIYINHNSSGNMLSLEQYGKIYTQKLNVVLIFDGSCEDIDHDKNSENISFWGNGYLTIKIKESLSTEEAVTLIKNYACHNLILDNIDGTDECIKHSDMLHGILFDPQVYGGQIVKWKNFPWRENDNFYDTIELFNKLWELKKLYIDLIDVIDLVKSDIWKKYRDYKFYEV